MSLSAASETSAGADSDSFSLLCCYTVAWGCEWTQTQMQRDSPQGTTNPLLGWTLKSTKRSVWKNKQRIRDKRTQKQTPLRGSLQTRTVDGKTRRKMTHVVPRKTQHISKRPRERGRGFWTGRQLHSMNGERMQRSSTRLLSGACF